MKWKIAVPILMIALLLVPALFLYSGDSEAQSASEVILLDRYNEGDERQSFGPGGEVAFKWLLYTEDNDTRYLVVITATADNSQFRVDVSCEGDENLIVDKEKIIYVKMTVTTDEEVDIIDTQITVTFKIIPLTTGKDTEYETRTVFVTMEPPQPAPVIEFIGVEVTPPWGEEYLEKALVRFVV